MHIFIEVSLIYIETIIVKYPVFCVANHQWTGQKPKSF